MSKLVIRLTDIEMDALKKGVHIKIFMDKNKGCGELNRANIVFTPYASAKDIPCNKMIMRRP